MLTDSHCHLASHRYSPTEIQELVERARAAGVTRIISLTTSLDDLTPNLQIAEDPAVHVCVGVHPCDVHHAPEDTAARLAEFTGDPRVCGIGETGLDYYHPAPDGWDEDRFRDRQRRLLHQHFELAAAAKLNIAIHSRDKEGDASFRDALAIYEIYHSSVRAVFHCFIGPWTDAARVIDLGGLVSFGGVATFKSARQVRETAAMCPPGSFMLETDAPYLAPEPHRGKRNEPSYTLNIAQHLAGVRGESLEQLAQHTNRAASSFFRLRPELG